MDSDVLRSRFIRAYAAVPSKMRGEIIALVDEKPFNWDSAYLEVNGKTAIGERILGHMEKIGALGD